MSGEMVRELIACSVEDIVEAMRRRQERARQVSNARAERLRLMKRGLPVPESLDAIARGE